MDGCKYILNREDGLCVQTIGRHAKRVKVFVIAVVTIHHACQW